MTTGLPAYLILLAYISSPGLWRTWSSWFRGSRAPANENPSETGLGLPSYHTACTATIDTDKPQRPTSSFYALATPFASTPTAPPSIFRSRFRSERNEQFHLQNDRKRPALDAIPVDPLMQDAVLSMTARDDSGTHHRAIPRTSTSRSQPQSHGTSARPPISTLRPLMPARQPLRQGDHRS